MIENERRTQAMENLRKIIRREAYLVEEERKIIQELRKSQVRSPHKTTAAYQEGGPSPQSESFVDIQKKELSLMQHNLKLEKDLQQTLNQ